MRRAHFLALLLLGCSEAPHVETAETPTEQARAREHAQVGGEVVSTVDGEAITVQQVEELATRLHLSPLDALQAFADLRARLLMPIHHGAFALSYEQLDEPVRLLTEAASARGLRDHLLVMRPGQSERIAS